MMSAMEDSERSSVVNNNNSNKKNTPTKHQPPALVKEESTADDSRDDAHDDVRKVGTPNTTTVAKRSPSSKKSSTSSSSHHGPMMGAPGSSSKKHMPGRYDYGRRYPAPRTSYHHPHHSHHVHHPGAHHPPPPPPPPPPHYGYDQHPYRPPYTMMPPHQYAYPPNYHHPYGSYPPPYPPSIPMKTESLSSSSASKPPKKKRSMDWESTTVETSNCNSKPRHRRDFSGTSTASTLSVGGMSMQSQERTTEDNPLTRASPKRRRGQDSNPISVELPIDEEREPPLRETERFEKLSVNDTSSFLDFDTSPINSDDVESTPVSKNTRKAAKKKKLRGSAFRDKEIDRDADTPTPPLPASDSDVMNDEMNRHLRGQSFTPLPHIDRNPSFNIQPQLSWSIAGDDPSLGDLAEWEEQGEKKRPSSTTSQGSNTSRQIALSPHSFTLWKDDDPANQHRTASRDDSIKFSMLSSHSDEEGGISGTTTPLPFTFGEERENAGRQTYSHKGHEKMGSPSSKEPHPYSVPENVHSIFVKRGPSKSRSTSPPKHSWNERPVARIPHATYPDPDYRSPHHGRDGPPPDYYYGPPPPPPPHMVPPNDRVRNLRGRAPPHHAPMHFHMPPHMHHQSHHGLASPLGPPGKNTMWGPPPPPPVPSSIEMNPSKRKCVPLKPPIPPKFQGDMEKFKTSQVPEFTSLVNFPAHMSQKQSVNLPEGMRCCVMCGQACPCSSGGKNKKKMKELAPRNGQDSSNVADKQQGFAIIPTQNKGLCTMCDVNVWVVCQSGLEIKWCKGCKNFRPWAAFGDKGLATKCLRCRERQREKYALQKEEKEKARMMAKAGKMRG